MKPCWCTLPLFTFQAFTHWPNEQHPSNIKKRVLGQLVSRYAGIFKVEAKKAVQHGAGYSWLIEGQAGWDSKWM